MNTDKTLDQKFVERNGYPIWYYKELKETNIDYIIWNLLKETFVVEIEGSKHEITFGKNRKGEIGQCIRYDDVKNSNLTSYKVVEKGFKKGKWFTVSDVDTTDEFKTKYREDKAQYEKEETQEWYRHILKNVIRDKKDLSEEQVNYYFQEIDNYSFEELESLISRLMKKFSE